MANNNKNEAESQTTIETANGNNLEMTEQDENETTNRINPDFSFTAYKNPDNEESNATTYYFEVDENDNPIHLGDGSYGMVYRVSNRKDGAAPGKFAVKIFYKTDEIEDRFKDELEFYETIRVKISSLGLKEKIGGLIEPVDGSKSFDTSEVAQKFFEEARFNVSPYAIVMKCYDGSLKDILETKSKDSGQSGYEALMACSFEQRIKAMYSFIHGITNGLKFLYLDDNAHLDIKPANIFYEKGKNSFEVILADIGFFSVNDIRRNHNTGTRNERNIRLRKQLLGSIHYRSPEQKYDIDKCQAKIIIDNDDVKIQITDPKFKGSLIEEGDALIFTKYPFEQAHKIRSFEKSSDDEPFLVEIKLDSVCELEENIQAENKTQVELIKMQRIRTDLFGIGAIAYDILTAGGSPERFYEKISSQDYEQNSIVKIMLKYTSVIDQNNDESELSYIFNSFVNKNQYADPKIVEFILKCMLYKVKDTFYEEFKERGGKKDYEVFGEVLKYIEKHFEKNYADQIATNSKLNPIISQNKVKKNEDFSGQKLDEFLQVVSNIQFDNYQERMYHGMKFFGALTKFLETNILNPNPEKVSRNIYFAELRPDILLIDNDYQLRTNLMAYPNFDKFIEGLKSHNAQKQLNTTFSHFFVPREVVNFRRKVKLFTVEKSENEFYYDFIDRSFHSDDFKIGDFLLSGNTEVEGAKVYIIKDVIHSSPRKKIKIQSLDEKKGDTESKLEDKNVFYYYRNLDDTYYMHMLAIYLQHLFFTNLGTNSKNLPTKVYSILYLNKDDSGNKEKLKLRPVNRILNKFKLKSGVDKKLAKILYMVVQTYLGLILHERIESKYAIGNINQLMGVYDNLRDEIIEYINIGKSDFSRATITSIEEQMGKISTSLNNVQNSFWSAEFNFEQMIDDILVNPNDKNFAGQLMDELLNFKERIFKKNGTSVQLPEVNNTDKIEVEEVESKVLSN